MKARRLKDTFEKVTLHAYFYKTTGFSFYSEPEFKKLDNLYLINYNVESKISKHPSQMLLLVRITDTLGQPDNETPVYSHLDCHTLH